jgi:Sel1 repeat
VPVLFDREDTRFIPGQLSGHTHYLLSSEDNYAKLYAFLTGQAGVVPGKLGQLKSRAREPVEPLTFGEPREETPSRAPPLTEDRSSKDLQTNERLPVGGRAIGTSPAANHAEGSLDSPTAGQIQQEMGTGQPRTRTYKIWLYWQAFRKKLWWFVLGTLAVAGIAICFPIFAEAKRYFALKTAAEAGSAEAMCKLGDLYKNGWGGVAIARSYEDARDWYKKAADAGNAWGMYDLGDLYKNGLGVTKDYIEARDWFERARRAGNPDSMYGLGDLYKNGGYGVDQDYGQAREWYQNAADAGSAWGMYDLAQLYEDGLLGAPDYSKARYWYRRAFEKGDEPPKKSAEEGLRRLLQPSNSK